MTLKSWSGSTEFELKVLGYEFPQITGDKYDSNWLMVNVTVKTVEASWSSTDPCMLTWESHWLLNWLADLVYGAESEADMSFMESNLEFVLDGRHNGTIGLRICFREKLRPPAPTSGDDDFEIHLELLPSDIRDAVKVFRHDLQPFPIRAGASWRCRPQNDRRTSCVLCTPDDLNENSAAD